MSSKMEQTCVLLNLDTLKCTALHDVSFRECNKKCKFYKSDSKYWKDKKGVHPFEEDERKRRTVGVIYRDSGAVIYGIKEGNKNV